MHQPPKESLASGTFLFLTFGKMRLYLPKLQNRMDLFTPNDSTPKGPRIEFIEITNLGPVESAKLDYSQGPIIVATGGNGSGKSTAMNIIGCLDRPTAGEYRFKGIPVQGLDQDARALLRRHALGFVFQGFNLLARQTALENVELPLIYKGLPAAERRALAIKALMSDACSGVRSYTKCKVGTV